MEAEGNPVRDAVLDTIAGVESELGAALFALEPACCLRRLPGRETFLVDLADPTAPVALAVDGDAVGVALTAQLPVVVKRFHARDAREARYELLHGRLPRSPAQREAENLSGLLSAGLPVPTPLFWCESGAASLVLLEYLPHSVTLRRPVEARAPEAVPFGRELAELVAGMHAAGWYHRDLYLEHVVLVDGRDGSYLALLDAGRARFARRPRLRWFVKDLAALAHSAPEGAPRLRFAAWYFAALAAAGVPLGRRARRRFLARVERRARRMAAHVPRHRHQPGPVGAPRVPVDPGSRGA